MIKRLEIVHTDLFGPTRTKGLNGEHYFMLLVDDYTRMTLVFFLRKKSKAFEHFKIYKQMVESEMDLKIKCLRSDNGREFTSKEFMDLCGEHGIIKIALNSQDTSAEWSCRKKEQNSIRNGQNHVERFQVE
jgi:transposase InsO family protein